MRQGEYGPVVYGDFSCVRCYVASQRLGNPEVLRSLLDTTFMMGDSTSAPIREFGYAVSMTREPITGGAWRRQASAR